jgi:7-cyano-7-deazaguanine synthase
MKNAIVLCSGGLDSIVTANYVKKILGYEKIIILFFNYGQKSLIQERKFSIKCSKKIGGGFKEINIGWLGKISNSLINKNGKIKKISKKDLKNTKKEGKKFYVPFRNGVFISCALAYAESLLLKNNTKTDIFVGFKCEGRESYPDSTKKFVDSVNNLSRVATFGFRLFSPLISKNKEDVILLGKRLDVDFKETFSCYSPIKGKHCGFCLACALRKQGFYWSGIKDVTEYSKVKG